MEYPTAALAVLPRRRPRAAGAGRDSTPAGCTIHWLHPQALPKPKRIAILDPCDIERRLLIALAGVHGHQVVLYHDAESLIAGLAEQQPQIAFVHMRFEPALRRVSDERRGLPPIVLIDSCGTTGHGQAHMAPLGAFMALRFPIGPREFAEAIRRTAL